MSSASIRFYHHSLLIFLIGSLLFVRLVDLHWHQPVCPPQAQQLDLHAAHLADAAAPQDEAQHFADVSLTGDDGFALQLPILPALACGLVLLLLLCLPLRGVPMPRELRAPPARRSCTRLPPGCGPPALIMR